tara:strand:- start:5189 stop:5686 length:498 start_codon:yes stop_codon:yes gene_type:complete
MNKKELLSRYLLDSASRLNEQSNLTRQERNAENRASLDKWMQIDPETRDTLQVIKHMDRPERIPDRLSHIDPTALDRETIARVINRGEEQSGQRLDRLGEQFQASGLDRRALGLIKNKDKSDLKNIIRSVVFELADDGYDEGDIQDFLGLIVRGEVKMLYKKAVK